MRNPSLFDKAHVVVARQLYSVSKVGTPEYVEYLTNIQKHTKDKDGSLWL